MCELQHGEAVVALANAQGNGFARIPALLLRLAVGGALPFSGGQDASRLAQNVNAGELAKTEGLHLIVDQIHAHVAGQQVVIGVTRLHHRFIHVHHAVTTLFVVAKTVVAKLEKPGVRNLLRRVALARLQGRQGHEGLISGARWVGAAQSPVEQRFVQGLVERLPVFNVNALDKQIGVKGGFADKGQHLAGSGVDGHQGAAAIAIQVFHQLLQLDVDGQHHRVAGFGWDTAQAPHRSPAGRGLHLVHAGDAVQFALVALLHTQLANVVGAPVVGGVI